MRWWRRERVGGLAALWREKAKAGATLVLVLTQGERLVEKHRLIKDDWKFLFVFSFLSGAGKRHCAPPYSQTAVREH